MEESCIKNNCEEILLSILEASNKILNFVRELIKPMCNWFKEHINKLINFVGYNEKVIIKYYNIEKYNKKMLRRKEMYRRKKAKYGK